MSKLFQALLSCMLIMAVVAQPTPMQCMALGRTYGKRHNVMKTTCDLAVVDCDTAIILPTPPALAGLQDAYFDGCYAALQGKYNWCRDEYHLDSKICVTGSDPLDHFEARAKWKCYYKAIAQTQCV